MLSDRIAEGKSYVEAFRLSDAEKVFNSELIDHPASVDAMVWLARVWLMKEQHEKADQLLDQALNLQPSHAEALALKGIYYMQKGDYENSVRLLEEARISDSNLEMIYFNLAKSYIELGRYDQAEITAKTAIKLNPKKHEAYFQLSRLYAKTNRIKDAIDSLLCSIRLNPRFLRGYVLLGDLYVQTGKGELVIELYKEGLRHNPSAFVLHQELCNLYALKLDFNAAYEEAMQLSRKRQFYGDYLLVGNYALAAGKFEEAESAFRKSLELNAKSWEGHYNLAELYRSAKLFDPARKEYELAMENTTQNFKPYNGMGIFLLHHEKNPGEAQKYFLRALEISPMQLEPMFNMALACALKNENDAAAKFASAVLKLSREGDDLHAEAERLLRNLPTRQDT